MADHELWGPIVERWRHEFEQTGRDWRHEFEQTGRDWRHEFEQTGRDWRHEFEQIGRAVLTEGRPTMAMETFVRLIVLEQRRDEEVAG